MEVSLLPWSSSMAMNSPTWHQHYPPTTIIGMRTFIADRERQGIAERVCTHFPRPCLFFYFLLIKNEKNSKAIPQQPNTPSTFRISPCSQPKTLCSRDRTTETSQNIYVNHFSNLTARLSIGPTLAVSIRELCCALESWCWCFGSGRLASMSGVLWWFRGRNFGWL
jgi:hypothetical protein